MNHRNILTLSLSVMVGVLNAATLRKDNFEPFNPWSGMSGYFTTGGEFLTVSPAHGATDLTLFVTSDSGTPAGNMVFLEGAVLAAGVHLITAADSGNSTCAASNSPEPGMTIVVLTPYEAWREQHFTQEEREDPQKSGPNADPDADGHEKLLGYACDTQPRRFLRLKVTIP